MNQNSSSQYQSNNRTNNQANSLSHNQFGNQANNQSNNQSNNQFGNQSNSQFGNQSANQSNNQSDQSSVQANTVLAEASATVDLVHQLSQLLNTGLTRTQLSLAIGLIECGVNPEALAMCIKELRAEAANQSNNQSNNQPSQSSAPWR